MFFNRTPTPDAFTEHLLGRISALEQKLESAKMELMEERMANRAIALPSVDHLPPNVEATIRSRWGSNPLGEQMTRSAVRVMLRSMDADEVLRTLDAQGEVVE